MGRPLRADSDGGWYHVVNRGVDRQPIFFDDRDRVEFCRLVGVAHERCGIVLHAYCLMTNHYHLVVECPTGGLSEAMHLIGSAFVRHVNERAGRDGPLFRARYFAKPVSNDEYLVQLATYVHRNPLAIVPPERLIEYRWSSLRAYAGHRRAAPWLRTDVVAELAGGAAALVELAKGERIRPPSVADGADVMSLVQLVVDDHVEERARRSAARAIAVLLLDVLDARSASQLRSELGFSTVNAERIVRSRARQRVRTDRSFAQAFRAATDALVGPFQFVPGTN